MLKNIWFRPSFAFFNFIVVFLSLFLLNEPSFAQKEYHFVSNWQLKVDQKKAWDVINDSEKWKDWWKSVTEVEEKKSGGENGIGNVRSYTIKSPIGYKLSFDLLLTKREVDSVIEGLASGDLIGKGAWYFDEKADVTYITCTWDVKTTKQWMNTFRFILAPLFKWNHKLVMKKGAKGLSKKLQCELVDY